MLFLVNNNVPTTVHPQLSRVWIKTGDPKLPLKGVWIDEAQLRGFASRASVADRESETRELAEDHLPVAA
jgi:hypothetical protein